MAHGAAIQDQVPHYSAGRLLDDRERKSSCAEKKEQRTHAHVLLSAHLLEDIGVQAHERAIESDGQEQIRVIVEIAILGRPKAISEEDLEAYDVDERCRQHVDVDGQVSPERTLGD